MNTKQEILEAVYKIDVFSKKAAQRIFQQLCAYGKYDISQPYEVLDVKFKDLIEVKIKVKIYDDEEILFSKENLNLAWEDFFMIEEQFQQLLKQTAEIASKDTAMQEIYAKRYKRTNLN